MPTIATAENL